MGNLVPDIRDVDVGRYYPDTVSPSREFQEIAKAENQEINKLWRLMWKCFFNTFVYDLDTDGAKRWERMLQLYPAKSDTLDTRRRAILAKLNSSLPYTERSLQQMLDGVYGAGKIKVSLDYNKYKLWLDVAPELILKSIAIRRYARVVAPANLTINVSNTVRLDFRVINGGLIRQTKHVSIYPASDFTVEIQNSVYTITGAVREFKYIQIRS